jgi:RNase H-fold protein (predicted Holliday junction resolvase)
MGARRIIGVDPGSAKAGYAVVDETGAVVEAGIVPVDGLADRVRTLAAAGDTEGCALGRGTNSAAVAARLAPLGLPVHLVDEYETTRFARALYFADHPPRGWRRLLPLSFQTPPRAIDDYAAILIARRFWESKGDPPPLA